MSDPRRYRENIRQNIRLMRQKQRLSQRELGERLNRNRKSIIYLEKTGNVSADELPAIAAALGVQNPFDLVVKQIGLV